MKKFELETESYIEFMGRKLFRIRALTSFGSVKAGDVGGYVEKEENLSQDGNAWVCGDAKVFGDAKVYGNAEVYGNAWVCGDAEVSGDADYITAKGFGSVQRTTTFFREKNNGIGVRCGCFYGDLDSFREKVKKTHGDSKMAREYLMLADLIEFKMKSPER